MTISTAVKYLSSTMQGAPQLTNAWGCMTALLDACLVTGFNLKSIDTLTAVEGIATASISAGHQYLVDQVVLISGADQAGYNGEFRVLGTTMNTFAFAVSGSLVGPATGAISVKTAPLGWDIAFTGTNKRAYRSRNLSSNRPLLRIDDGCDPVYTSAWAKYAKITMAQDMSDIDTFIGARAPYDPSNPTKNEVGSGSGASCYNGWFKWYYARNTNDNWQDTSSIDEFNRHWVLVGDDRGFYLFNEIGLAWRSRSAHCFTDFASFRQNDGFDTLLVAKDGYTQASAGNAIWRSNATGFVWSLEYNNKIVMRDHTQIGLQQRVGFTSLNTNNGQTVSGWSTGIPWPNPSDYGLILHPVYLMQENSKGLRGKLPGLMWIHNDQPLADLAVVDNVVGYSGRKFLIVGVSASDGNMARVALDITGPWW